ncbi:response regulator [Candidatus Peregrinibacteria bacterium]|nr:response regulator [Candidatus Peregrinibacteria bacterium]
METIKKEDRVNNILFVDSDKGLTGDIKDWVKKSEIETKYNLRFTFVEDAKSALKKLAEMNINMVILEIALPLVSGYYLVNAIKNLNKEISIIIYTSLKNPQDLAKMASSKVNNIFLKELMSIQDLVEIIRKKESSENIDEIVMELSSQIKALHASEKQSELKLIQCPQCRLILAPDSHFCNNCGQKIFRKTKKILTQAEDNKKKPVEKDENVAKSEKEGHETSKKDIKTKETEEKKEMVKTK